MKCCPFAQGIQSQVLVNQEILEKKKKWFCCVGFFKHKFGKQYHVFNVGLSKPVLSSPANDRHTVTEVL